jgi:ATP-binding cassette subfamily B protein
MFLQMVAPALLAVVGYAVSRTSTTPVVPILFVAGLVSGAAHGFLYPGLAALVADQAHEARRGTVIGVFSAVFLIGNSSGAFLFGGVAHRFGYGVTWSALAALLLVGGRQAIRGSITIGDFVAFYGYVLMLVSPMRMLGFALGMAQRAVAAGARVFELLDRKPELAAPPGAPPLPEGDGQVELRGVTFAYNGGEPVLRDVDLEVEPGRTVALVGATGSGKTTLVLLVPRLYDVDQGAVLVDGADVRSVDPASLRRQVALVSDDAFLFSATLGENIAYARPDASEEEIREAARRAGLQELLDSLPVGLDTLVGERGLTLSGGQRQRVAIARALLAEPRILILDDATSSVDASTEAEIKRALREVMEGRTTFVIAHRLSTIALADEVVVLDTGRVVARGTHDELLERSPLYREIAENGLPDRVFLTMKAEADPEVAASGRVAGL